MSPPVVAAVAWLALAAVAGLGAALVVIVRRLDGLTREHTARKWEIATLRAELAALRRERDPPDGPDAAPPPDPEPSSDGPHADPGRAGRPVPSSPTAWRRGRARPPVRPPRRRRPG